MTVSPPGRVAQTLGFRLAFWYAAIFTASVLLIAVIAYALLARSLTQRDHDLIRVKLADYAGRFESAGVAGVSRAVAAEQASGSEDQVFVRLVGSNAEILLTSMPPSWGSYALEQLGNGEGWRIVPARGAPVRLEVAGERLLDGTILQVGRTTLERERFLRDVRALLSALFAIVVVVGLVGGSALTWQAFRPVRDLRDTLRHITDTGRLDARVPVGDERDVLSELGRVSNAMLARIEALVAGMHNALDAVAHDLRTPIARLRGRAEQALLAPPDAASYREALEDTVEEADRVSSLLTTLMDISEAEAGTLQLRREPVDVTRALRETVDLYEDLAESRGLRLVMAPPVPGLMVNADYPRLRQALANLVDNAIKYTPAGGEVVVTAESRNGTVAFTVGDTGPGISDDQRERIWERLYRGESGQKQRGLGLGLSLVRAVVEAHGGRAEVESTEGRGSTFTLLFPAAPKGVGPSPNA
jgi:signal transduction histidine kinase